MEEKNYYSVPAISNSGMGDINPEQGGSPKRYKKFVVDKEGDELDTPSLANGKLVHLYVEDPDAFLVSDVDRPSDMMAAWIEEVNEAFPWTAESLTPDNIALKECIKGLKGDRYKTLKNEEKIVTKFFESIDYLNHLIRSEGKICMTSAQKKVVEGCIESLHKNKLAERLLFDAPEQFGATSVNEKALYWKEKIALAGTSIELPAKALLDRMTLDPLNKKGTLTDLKTTGKPIANFENSFEYYRYYRQMGWYRHAMRVEIDRLYGEGHSDSWTIEVYIVAVETSHLHETRVFYIGDRYLDKGAAEAKDLVDRIGYCTYYSSWDQCKEEKENGYINLELDE